MRGPLSFPQVLPSGAAAGGSPWWKPAVGPGGSLADLLGMAQNPYYQNGVWTGAPSRASWKDGSMATAGNPGLPGWKPWMKDLKAPQNPMAGGMNYGQQSGMGGLESVLNAYSPKMKTGPY